MDGSFIPGEGTVPATLPGLLWSPKQGYLGSAPDASGVTMVNVTAAGEVEVEVDIEQDTVTGDFILKPKSPLEADADYIVRGADYCVEAGMTGERTVATLHTSAAAPLPASLGVLTAEAPSIKEMDVWTVSGSCTSPITASKAALTLELSTDAAPWASALILTTLVDGKPWGQLSGKVLYAQCESDDDGTDPGLAEGTHSVSIKGTLPGSNVAVETDPISVTLDCDPEPPPEDSNPQDPVPEGSDPQGGCSVARSPAPLEGGAAGAWLVAAGGAAVLSLLRRRRR